MSSTPASRRESTWLGNRGETRIFIGTPRDREFRRLRLDLYSAERHSIILFDIFAVAVDYAGKSLYSSRICRRGRQFDRCAATARCAKLAFAAVLLRFPEVRPAVRPKSFTMQRERLNR